MDKPPILQTNTSTSLQVARLIYIIISVAAGMSIAYLISGSEKVWLGSAIGIFIAGFFILIESLSKTYTIRGFSTGTFGLMVGLFCAWLLTRLDIPLLITSLFKNSIEDQSTFILACNTILFSSLGFLGTVIALRSSHNDFAVVIPYVRFRQDAQSGRVLLLDTEVIIDGRITAIIETGFLDINIVIPRFVLDHLQVLANSPSLGKQQRSKRGIETLDNLRKNPALKVSIHDSYEESSGDSHETLLLQISRLLNAKILTTDENLAKIARLQNADVLNLKDIEAALKETIDVGSRLTVTLVRNGKENHQALGYLADGTMIVVNQAVEKIGTSQNVSVISTINTSAGLMVFADIDEDK